MAKRLKRNQYGSIVLPSGETITPKEQRALRSAVTRANKERQRLLDELPEVAKQKYKDFGQKNEFHIRKKSKGFAHFENKAEFKRYLSATKRIASGAFEKMTLKNMYSNYIISLYHTFNSKAEPLVRIISKMTEKELKYAFDSGILEDTGYVYWETEVEENERLKTITEQLEAIQQRMEG